MDAEVYRVASKGSWNELDYFSRWHDQVTPTGNTVLHVHVGRTLQEGKTNIEFIKKILDWEDQWGERPSILWHENDDGDILLHLAARYGHVEAVEELIRRTKAVNEEEVKRMLRKTNKWKDTALHEAARGGHGQVAKLLVKADPSSAHEANDDKETPLYLAAERGSADCVNAILNICDPSALAYDHKGPCGRTILHILVQWGRPRDIAHNLLCNHESLIIIQDDEGSTPLHTAAVENNVEYLRVLLMYDKKMTNSAAYIRDNEGRTPLHVATLHLSWESIKELIEHRPDCMEIVDNRGQNAVHYAANWACIRKLKRLLKLGHDFNKLMIQKDLDGNTPLHLAAASVPRMTCFCMPNVKQFFKGYQQYMMLFNNENLTVGDILAPQKYAYYIGVPEFWMPPRGGRIKTKKVPDHSGSGAAAEDVLERIVPCGGEDGAQSRLVVAALVATVSFTAGFTVPGGFNQNSGSDIGMAVLAKNTAFKAFLVFDAIALAFSGLAVFGYTQLDRACGGARKWVGDSTTLQFTDILNTYSVGAMMLAFVTGVYAVVPHSLGLQIALFTISVIFFWGFWSFAGTDSSIVFAARYFHII